MKSKKTEKRTRSSVEPLLPYTYKSKSGKLSVIIELNDEDYSVLKSLCGATGKTPSALMAMTLRRFYHRDAYRVYSSEGSRIAS